MHYCCTHIFGIALIPTFLNLMTGGLKLTFQATFFKPLHCIRQDDARHELGIALQLFVLSTYIIDHCVKLTNYYNEMRIIFCLRKCNYKSETEVQKSMFHDGRTLLIKIYTFFITTFKVYIVYRNKFYLFQLKVGRWPHYHSNL